MATCRAEPPHNNSNSTGVPMTAFRTATLPARSLLAAALALALGSAQAQTATEAELARKLDQLANELAVVKAQLVQLQQQRAAQPAPAAPVVAPVAAVAAPVE